MCLFTGECEVIKLLCNIFCILTLFILNISYDGIKYHLSICFTHISTIFPILAAAV